MKASELRRIAEVVVPPPPPKPLALPPWKGEGYDHGKLSPNSDLPFGEGVLAWQDDGGAQQPEDERSVDEIVKDYMSESWTFMKDSMELLAELGQMDYVSVQDRAAAVILSARMKKFLDENAHTIADLM